MLWFGLHSPPSCPLHTSNMYPADVPHGRMSDLPRTHQHYHKPTLPNQPPTVTSVGPRPRYGAVTSHFPSFPLSRPPLHPRPHPYYPESNCPLHKNQRYHALDTYQECPYTGSLPLPVHWKLIKNTNNFTGPFQPCPDEKLCLDLA